MKKIFSMIFSILFALTSVFPAYAKPDWPADTGIEAESGIVMDADTGAVIFGQGIHVQNPPASITKILTALIVVENSTMEEMVTFSHDAVYNIEEGSGNYFGFDEGDTLSVKDCLYALLLRSSNQAANALAEHVGGSRDGFVEMMNQKVASLGCTNTRFANPSGLNDETQLTTPYDMARIARAAFGNETVREISSTVSYTLGPTIQSPEGLYFKTENKFLLAADESDQQYAPYVVASKTGYTSLAGNTLVTYGEQDGRRQVAVILQSNQTHYKDTKTMMEFGFARFMNLEIAANETAYTTGEEPVVIGETSYAPSDLQIEAGQMVTIPKDAAFTDLDKELVTELPEGHSQDAVAQIVYTYNERRVGSALLLNKNAAEEPSSQEESQPQGESESESQAPDESADAANPENQTNSQGNGRKVLLAAGGALALAALVGAFVWKRQKEAERKRAELRKEKRKKRLEEIGYTEEQFYQIMEEQKKKKNEDN